METILLFLSLPILSALSSAIIVFQKPTPALVARRWLLLSMLCGALSAGLLAHYYIPGLRLSVMLDMLFDAVLLCLAPCFYLCLLSLTSLNGIRRRDYLVFVPGAVLMSIIIGLNIIMGADEAQAALEEIVLRTRPVRQGHSWAFRAYAFFGHQFYRSFTILSLMTVFYWGALAIHDYQKRLEDYLVDISPSLVRGIQLLYLSFVLFSAVGMVFAACEYAQTFTSWVIPSFSIGIALSFAMMGHFAQQVTCSAEELLTDEHWTSYTEVATLPLESHIAGELKGVQAETREDPFRERLAIIERKHLYRNPHLTIFSLSRTIGTNRTYLTRAFRECYGESFSEHINRLRIEEAVQLMLENPHMTQQEIALHVGYNSSTSLYRNFVRVYGCSPSEYLKKGR